jgi:hypothetical protein
VILDMFTLHVVASLVVVVAGILYVVETILRKDGAAGRLWSVAFLAGMMTVVCYLVWAAVPTAFVAVALGNGGFVASAAFVWLGARAFNGHSLRLPGILTLAGIALAVGAVFVAGPQGGDWAGAVPLFATMCLFGVLGAVESRRGAIGRRWSAIGLTVVLIIEAAFFAGRLTVFLALGPDSDLFRTWFSSVSASLLTVVLTTVTVVVTSVLRASESNLRGQRDTYTLHVGLDGVLMPASLRSAVSTLLERAERAGETVCLVALRLDDLPRIATAFGPGEAEAIAAAWRTGVRRYAPTASLVGEDGETSLLVAFLTASFVDVRRTASIIHRRIIDDFAGLGLSIAPVVGVGIALTDRFGYGFVDLAAAAAEAAERSVSSRDASVIVAGV